MAKTEAIEPTISVENKSRGPLDFDPGDPELAPEWRVLSFGDPIDRGRRTDDGILLPQPEVTMPVSVWEWYSLTFPAIPAMIKSGDLIAR